MNFLPAFVLLFLCAISARGQDGQSIPELTKALRAELRAELIAGLDKETVTAAGRLAKIEALLLHDLPAEGLEEGPIWHVAPALLKVEVFSESAKAQALVKELHRRLKAQDEKRTLEQKEAAAKLVLEGTRTMREVAQTMLKAEKAADLDGPLRTMLGLKNEAAKVSAAAGFPKFIPEILAERAEAEKAVAIVLPADFMEQIGKLLEVMGLWQELLVAAASEKRDPRGPIAEGKPNPPHFTAHQLKTALTNAWPLLEQLLERSAALERIEVLRKQAVPPPPAPFDPIAWHMEVRGVIGKIGELREIEPALKAIEELTMKRLRETPSPGFMWRMSDVIPQLQAIAKAYNDLEAKVPVPLDRTAPFMTSGSNGAELLASLRQKLLRRLVPSALGADAEPIPENETLEAYVLRKAAKAKADHDWRKLDQIFNVLSVVQTRSREQNLDAMAVRSLITAGDYERGGEVSLAVASYLGVVKLGAGQEIMDWTAARLKELKEKSPTEYERGLTLVDAPKRVLERIRQEYPDAFRAMAPARGGGDGAPNRPGFFPPAQ